MNLTDIFHSAAAAALWPWLFPATYLIHIAEEHRGGQGFSAHMAQSRGVHFTSLRFFFLTGIGLVLMVAGILLAQRLRFLHLLLVILGTVVLANGLSHTLSGIFNGTYNPGLISGLLIWIPLGAATLYGLAGGMPMQRYAIGILIGLGIQAVVSWLALQGGKIPTV